MVRVLFTYFLISNVTRTQANTFTNINPSNRLRHGSSNIQSVYDIVKASLLHTKDINQILNDPVSIPEIRNCMDFMGKVTLDEIGVENRFPSRLSRSVCMNVCSTPQFDIAIFMLPAQAKIPLHDHPNMMVLSKLLCGDLSVRAFTPFSRDGDRIRARRTASVTKTAADDTWYLGSSDNNIHEFTALTPCVILDVLLPPYALPERPCTYYKAEEDDSGSTLTLTVAPPPTDLPIGVQYRGTVPTL